MAVNISGKLAWVRNHPIVSLAVSCSSLLLLIPRVMSIVVFFWPLLVSTALFVTALLTVGNAHLEEGQHKQVGVWCDEDVGENSFPQGEENLNEDRSLLECVKEQHEGGRVLFDSMFEDQTQQQPTTLVNHKEITHTELGEKEREGVKPVVNGEEHNVVVGDQHNPPHSAEETASDRAQEVGNERGSAAEGQSEISPPEEPAACLPRHQEGAVEDNELSQ